MSFHSIGKLTKSGPYCGSALSSRSLANGFDAIIVEAELRLERAVFLPVALSPFQRRRICLEDLHGNRLVGKVAAKDRLAAPQIAGTARTSISASISTLSPARPLLGTR